MRAVLDTSVVVASDVGPLDGDLAISAASYGQLAAAVAGAGRRPRPRAMELLVAATAHAHRARLYTRNPADLAGTGELIEIVEV